MRRALFPAAFYARPLIPLTVAFMAGIALGSLDAGVWGEVAALTAVLAGAARTAFCLARGRFARLSPLILISAVGVLSIQPWSHPRLPADHVSRLVDTGPWEITGTVDGRPMDFESRIRLILRVEGVSDGQMPQRASGILRVTLLGPTPELHQGDRIRFKSRIRPIRNFNNPGGFDYRRYMAHQGVWAAATGEGPAVVVVETNVAGGVLASVDALRGRISRQIDAAGLGPEATVLKALVIGDRTGITPEVREAFTRTGLNHLLAISGLHIGIVASAAFVLFRWLLDFWPRLLMTGAARKAAAILTLGAVAFYALLAGMSPSTQRALVMAAAFLLAFLLERDQDLLNTLALAALAILGAHPPALFSISFQLSFAAVFAIIIGLPPVPHPVPGGLRPDPPTRAARIRQGAVLFLKVSLLATAGTLPLVMHYFNTISFIGIPANVVAIPLIGYLAVLAGLAGALVGLVWPGAAEVLFQAGGVILAHAMAAVGWMARLPFAAARTVTPSGVEIGLYYLALGCAVHLLRRRRERPIGARPAAEENRNGAVGGRWAHPARILLVLCLLLGAADAAYWLHQRYWHRDLRMTLIDVGQGSAALIELPGGRTMLIDGGGFADNAAFDVGAAVVAPYLWRRKIATVDRLILTHPNSDHLNGLVFIAENFNVGSLWTNGEPWHSQAHRALMRAAAARGIARPRFDALPRESHLEGVKLEVLYPPADFSERREVQRWRRDPNNNSLVTRFSYGEVSILLPGDIMHPAEKELVALAGGRLKTSVLVAPHHGSRTSSSEEFLGVVQPQVVLISCAGRPGSGLSHPQVIERYAQVGVAVYRTDRHGAIRLATDGRRLRIEPFIPGE